jgi:hypothetical protein
MTPRLPVDTRHRITLPAWHLLAFLCLALGLGTVFGANRPAPGTLLPVDQGATSALVGPDVRRPPSGGLTLVIHYGLTDRFTLRSTMQVGWTPGSGAAGLSLSGDELLLRQLRLGPEGVPWVPHLLLRVTGRPG